MQIPFTKTELKLHFKKYQNLDTILIIDDQVDCQLVAQFLLKPLSCKIVTAISAEEAFEYLCKHENRVNLILSDIDLPGMTGLEFLFKIKQDNRFKDIPVILQTGCEYSEVQKGLNLGAQAVVRKPYTKTDLYEALNQLDVEL